jgi:malonyl-CoA O-methyltransferase
MILSDDIQRVRKKFSNAAERYDSLAFVQNAVRKEFHERFKIKNGSSVLDVGCGTGALLRGIAPLNLSGLNIGVDPAAGMIERARQDSTHGIFLEADACRLPFRKETFDIVVSSSSYQWVMDLNKAFASVRNVLKPWGAFKMALFGRGTLKELLWSLDAASAGDVVSSQIRRLPTVKDVWHALDWAKLRDIRVHCEERVVVFEDLRAVMTWLKGVGANSLGKVFLGRRTLERAQKHYADHYAAAADKGVKATFEVIWAEAVK